MADELRIERRSAEAAWPEVEALSAIVYTPEMLAHGEFHDVAWSQAESWVLAYRGDMLVSSAGIHRRTGAVHGEPALIAGIGGVKTHPDHQGQGLASAVMEAACAAIDSKIAPDFSLICVETHNRAFYAKRGWRLFEGRVIAEQHGARVDFRDKGTMLRGGAMPTPVAGTIDLMGRPW